MKKMLKSGMKQEIEDVQFQFYKIEKLTTGKRC